MVRPGIITVDHATIYRSVLRSLPSLLAGAIGATERSVAGQIGETGIELRGQ